MINGGGGGVEETVAGSRTAEENATDDTSVPIVTAGVPLTIVRAQPCPICAWLLEYGMCSHCGFGT